MAPVTAERYSLAMAILEIVMVFLIIPLAAFVVIVLMERSAEHER
jgi:hypothetical protein